MTIYRDFDNIVGRFAACIGFFDGVHRGHQFLLHHLCDEAAEHGLQSAVVTFVRHPRTVIQPDYPLQLIDTLPQRLDKLQSLGIDACFLIDFDESIRCLTAQQFITDVLRAKMHISRLLIGYDHRFGHNRTEGFADYVRYGQACGMDVVQQPMYEDNTGLHYSSSEVRRALQAGDISRAKAILGWED